MFTVTSVHLSSDTTVVDPTLGHAELGSLSEEEFIALLYRFRALDAGPHPDADPHLLVSARAGRFIIRTGRGKLSLYNARDTTEPYAELTPAEIVTQIDRQLTSPPFEFITAQAPAKPTPRYGIAFAILLAGLGLNAYTLYSVFYTATVVEKPAITLLTDPAELATRSREVVGTFATGAQSGDRVITVHADGTLSFSEIGLRTGLPPNTDSYRLGRHDKKLCLLTTESGVVDIAGVDTLVYYRDTYRRTR
jgi:hypothetical protein